ncbi:MAG: aspartate/glutamate racemase family protein [Candidatus Peribacteria bacterium]|nr:MAG: aspartate/glutamate racemase family protein [Candidatus Peribacteria bacterium]
MRELNQYQPNVVCMICNTIHLFYEHLSSALDKSVEFVYLPSIVEEYLTTQTQKICVLGTQNTIINGLYYFDSLENIYLEKDVQNTINMAIFKFNNGEDFSHEKHIIEEAIEDVLIHHSDIKFVM